MADNSGSSAVMSDDDSKLTEPSPADDAAKKRDADLISQNLKKMFSDVESEPLPDKLAALMQQFRDQERTDGDA